MNIWGVRVYLPEEKDGLWMAYNDDVFIITDDLNDARAFKDKARGLQYVNDLIESNPHFEEQGIRIDLELIGEVSELH